VVGELVPKRIGLQAPERIAAAAAPVMRLLSRVTAPIIHLLSLSTEGVLRLLNVHESSQPAVTVAEVKALMDEGREAGVFQLATQEMVSNVFRLDELRVSASMTPRPEIVWLDTSDTPEELRKKIIENPFIAFPVCSGSPDNVQGVVRSTDLLRRYLSGEPIDLSALMTEVLFVPESVIARDALERLRRSPAHLALVIGEHGDVQGLVTMRDLLAEVVGDLDENAAVMRSDGSWLIDGLMPSDELKALLDVEQLPNEADYQTVGGFVMTQLGHIPRVAELFVWGGYRFEVVDMDGKRVDKVLVRKVD